MQQNDCPFGSAPCSKVESLEERFKLLEERQMKIIYLLYAAMFAAIGSAVDNEADTQQLQLPMTLPLIVGLFIMLHTFEHPSSQLSIWASIIPWTSPMVMLARIPFNVVPAWQLILSLVLLFLTFLGTAWVSAKIYKAGILMYGKKSSFKDLWHWIRMKE